MSIMLSSNTFKSNHRTPKCRECIIVTLHSLMQIFKMPDLSMPFYLSQDRKVWDRNTTMTFHTQICSERLTTLYWTSHTHGLFGLEKERPTHFHILKIGMTGRYSKMKGLINIPLHLNNWYSLQLARIPASCKGTKQIMVTWMHRLIC